MTTWGKNRRAFFGGEYPYETLTTVFLPEGQTLSSAQEGALTSRAMLLLGDLEVNRRMAGLPSMATHYTEADGTYYEYGFIMGQPFVRVWPTSKPPESAVAGLSGIVFYHEAIRSNVLYRQGIVARDDGGIKPDKYVMVDAPWSGYGSKNKALLFGSGGPIDERLMFSPHAVSYSKQYGGHVVVKRSNDYDHHGASDFNTGTAVFIGGVLCLRSTQVDFVGAQLYGDALCVAYIDGASNLAIATLPLDALAYDQVFIDPPTAPRTAVPDFMGGEDTVCNFHPTQKKASFVSLRRTNSGGNTLLDYVYGEFAGGAFSTIESADDFYVRRSIPLTTGGSVTIVQVETYNDNSGSYPTTPADSSTYDYSVNIPANATVRIDLNGLPIWVGYDDSGEKILWRLRGFAESISSGAYVSSTHFVDGVGPVEAYGPSIQTNTEIDLYIYKVVDTQETQLASYPIERHAVTADTAGVSIGNSYGTAFAGIAGEAFIGVRLSGIITAAASRGPTIATATATNSLGGSIALNSSNTYLFPERLKAGLLPENTTAVGAVPSGVRKDNTYQKIYGAPSVLVEEKGQPDLEVVVTNKSVYASYSSNLVPGGRFIFGPDPFSGLGVVGPVVVTRTVVANLTDTTIGCDASNNVFARNYCGRGVLYDHRLRKHIVSPWGVLASDIINVAGSPTKNIYCVSKTQSVDITGDIVAAGQDEDATAKLPNAPVGNVFVDDFFDPRGII